MRTTVILAAKAAYDQDSYQVQMLPVRGKPALDWVISAYYEKENVVLVLNNDNVQAINYFSSRYKDLKIIQINSKAELDKYGCFTILNSINAGITNIESSIVDIVLGDTLCKGFSSNSSDFVLTSNDFTDSSRWCLVEKDKDNYISKFFDKQKNLDIIDKKALVGFYSFSDAKLVKRTVENLITNKKENLSDLLTEYSKEIPIKSQDVALWLDLGHKSGIIKAQNIFFNSRDFNSLSTDLIKGTITKTSPNIQKLHDEYLWCTTLPEELQVIAPRCISFNQSIDNASLTMEMYGYSALSELFILGNLSLEEWQLIIKRLFDIHKLFQIHKGHLDKENFYDLYYNKTWNRLKLLQEQNYYWENLWDKDEIIINDQKYDNIRIFQNKIDDAIEHLVNTVDVSIMHGDYCFSNILFDTNSFICRVIDPRGRLGEQTIYGDPRYDIAKLRHSIVGGYDYVVHGLYNFCETESTFKIENNYPDNQKDMTLFFDNLLVDYDYDLIQIKLIEALLFLSMIPLHKDNITNQKIFYLKAVIKFNDLFGDKND